MHALLESILLQISQSEQIDNGNLKSASRLILESICRGLRISRAGIWLLDESSNSISCKLLIDAGQELTSQTILLTREQFPNYFKALDSERTIAADDAHNHVATSEFSEVYLAPLDISSMLDVPLRHQGKMIGIICCEHRGIDRIWREEEKVFSSAIADLYGRAISAQQKSEYEQKLISINQNLEALVAERTKDLEATLNQLKQTQSKLVETEKMAALGNLIAGVAHEVNTPLGTGLTSVTHCLESLTKLESAVTNKTLGKSQLDNFIQDTRGGLQLAEQSLNKASQLIRDFKRTTSDQISDKIEGLDLSLYLAQVVNPISAHIKKQSIQLNLSLAPNLLTKTYPGVIAQITTNLITNAIQHAFPEQNANNEIKVITSKQGENFVFEISDNGVGIKEQDQKQVFEPFFTSKRGAGSSGLGLSTVYNLVSGKLAGQIELVSKPKQGTRFIIKFPSLD